MIVDIILKNSVIKNKNEGEAAAAPMELTGLSSPESARNS